MKKSHGVLTCSISRKVLPGIIGFFEFRGHHIHLHLLVLFPPSSFSIGDKDFLLFSIPNRPDIIGINPAIGENGAGAKIYSPC